MTGINDLPLAELAINNRDAASTGVSLFFLTHLFHVSSIDIADAPPVETPRNPIEFVDDYMRKAREVLEWAQLLHAAATDPLPSQRQTNWQPPAIETPEGPEFEIEEIQGERTYQRKKQYLIKWVGWAEPTWNDVSLLQEAKALNA
ncbi:uncharacterized protein PADG_11498 [Paracoccidioides brasiliensis Pb18]|uniref:Chromo domain-containing protein n=1 Tax=Paracoccidioides brasiliensis (strain Pb18) TaxID=502780 RepID=A0A0A0HUN5_PARBD|nr:uncharacterized protein PADG_11498 [Paracoccidioides brasiliensis Pb18]KGM92307.1 hypothetical protein PADG_11498 [Paracoccidioides brasiliensis Pb18]